MATPEKKPDVLHIDPDPQMREVLAQALPDVSFDEAQSVTEGTQKIEQRIEEPYKLVVFEIEESIDGQNIHPGIDFARRVTADERLKDTKLLAHSTDHDPSHEALLRGMGVEYLEKPFDTSTTLPKRIRESLDLGD